jgi:hypothetical protein
MCDRRTILTITVLVICQKKVDTPVVSNSTEIVFLLRLELSAKTVEHLQRSDLQI